jgi:D-alanine-D-alanine ligase
VAGVCVLTGGRSLERAVSLRSASRVERALLALGHATDTIDMGPDLTSRLRAGGYDAAFICAHGPGGEDGTVQELCEMLGLPYTGAGVSASARCFDKALLKDELRRAGIATPPWLSFAGPALAQLGAGEALPDVADQLGLPLIVKPARMGSALGIGVARDEGELRTAVLSALAYDERVVVERFREGARDLAVGVLDAGDGPRTLPVVEAIPQGRQLYDFDARYTPGLTEFAAPADLDRELAEEAGRIALDAYRTMGVRGFGRVDLILSEEGIEVIDLPTIPGLTETSLLPMAAEAAGIGFDRLVATILASALCEDPA